MGLIRAKIRLSDLRIGIHTSIAGALERSAHKAAELGAEHISDFFVEPATMESVGAKPRRRYWYCSVLAKNTI